MSKLNKLVTNYPVELTEEEIANLSGTLAPVVAACGGGGGGTGGKIYTGVGFVNVNNTTNQIGLTEAANNKLNQDIPTKVSDLTDSANYQTVAGMDEYQTKEAMSAYATTAYVSGVTASIYYTNILGLVDALSAKQDKLTFGYDENDAISSINNHEIAGTGGVTGDYYSASNPSGFINSTQAETQILAKNYITSGVSELDNFYSKTDTSSKTELQTKFNSLLDYDVVTGNSAVLITTADADNTRTFTISLTATPTAADTVLNGQNGVDATLNGNVWNVGLSQSAYNAVNNVQNKLDTSVAAQTYQPIGNYLSSNALEGYATQQWVGEQGYLTTIPSEYVTDTELQTSLSTYATKTLVQNTSADIIELIPSTAGLASETDLQIVSAGVDYVSAHAITAHQSLTDYYTKSQTSGATEITNALGNKVDKPSSLQNKYLVLRTDNAGNVSGWVDFNDNVYSKSEADGRYQKKEDMGSYLTTAKYATDSATFYPTSNPDGYLTKTDTDTYYQPKGDYATSAGLTEGNQYAMTTNGWSDIGLSAYLPLSGGTVSGDVIVKSTGKNLLAVNTNATLMGQSRVANLNDTTAKGTNWMGVNSYGGGFIKNVQGGNVGDLDGTSIQINFAPNGNTAYGNITVESQGNASKVVHVPTASYDTMSSFDNTNGPNYMLRKTASGFDIGACVINVTTLPAQTEANTYYFIYDT